MKKEIILSIAAALNSAAALAHPPVQTRTEAQTLAPAFPGAEGHGRYVTGGRGGEIIHVTDRKSTV